MSDFSPKTFSDSKKDWTNFADLCKSCGMCIEKCPQKCIEWDEDINGIYGNPSVKCEIARCIACGICENNCPDMAIRVDKKS